MNALISQLVPSENSHVSDFSVEIYSENKRKNIFNYEKPLHY